MIERMGTQRTLLTYMRNHTALIYKMKMKALMEY
jgi:hypothetical protein